MTGDVPDWDLLASDPKSFFELIEGWDRRDLRRAYGRWIKRFKPDAHPVEFRKIRAGFERLEDELRFRRMDDKAKGEEQMPSRSPIFERGPSDASTEKSSGDEASRDGDSAAKERPEQPELIASIAERGPAAVLRELQEDFPLWWVPHYLGLFLDGDELASDEVFEQQLVTALQDRPREPVLLNLMRSWVRRRRSIVGGHGLLKVLRSLPDMTLAVVATPLLKQLAVAGQVDALEEELRRLEVSPHLTTRGARRSLPSSRTACSWPR